MAKGKKKRKKHQTRKQRAAAKLKLAKMSGEQLAARAAGCIARGKIREGIDAYKQALKNDGDPALILPGLFHAYFLRFKELKGKNMQGEAMVVQNMGARILEQISLPDPNVLKTAVLFFPVADTVAVYKKYLEQNPPLSGIEKNIGSRLVTENCLKLAEKFDESSGLRRDAPIVETALESMNSGLWDQAFGRMRKVSRRSPYADIKGFAKAMTAFGRGDRLPLAKALTGLDKGFPLKAAVLVLDAWANDLPVDPQGKYQQTTGLLMGKSIQKDKYRRNLEDAMARRDAVAMGKWAKALAGLLRFKSPTTGLVGILEIIGSRLARTDNEVECFHKLVNRSIGSQAKQRMILSKAVSAGLNFLSFFTPDYIHSLGEEFPDERDRQTALSVILVRVIYILKNHSDFFYEYDEELEDLFYSLNLPDEVAEEGDDEDILFHLAQKALDADPENKEVYDIVLDLPADTPAMRKALVPCLEKLVNVYDRDHRACLKLARIFYLKAAYRKAEKVLAQAYERSPYDLHVKEEYALSFVIAAAGNLKRGKIDLAKKDLDKAKAFNIRGLKVFIAEKKLVASALRTKKFSKDVFEKLTQGFVLGETLKALLLFKLDAQDPGFDPPLNTRGVDTVFKQLKKQVDTLDTSGARDLIGPLKGTREKLFFSGFFAGPLMEKRAKILDLLDDEGFISLIIDLVLSNCRAQVIRQLKKRLNQKDNALAPVFAFYHAAFEYMDGNPDAARKLDAIAGAADDRLKERFRKTARALAGIAPYPVKDNFAQFDFRGYGSWGLDQGDWDEDDWDEDDWDEDDAIIDDALNRMVEEAVKHGLIPPLPGNTNEPESKLFDPEAVFGKGKGHMGFGFAVENLAGAATAVVNRVQGDGYDMGDFFEDCFDQFMDLVKTIGLTTSTEYRQAGRNFAQQFSPSKDIVRALDIRRLTIGGIETQHFIMGMRAGI